MSRTNPLTAYRGKLLRASFSTLLILSWAIAGILLADEVWVVIGDTAIEGSSIAITGSALLAILLINQIKVTIELRRELEGNKE